MSYQNITLQVEGEIATIRLNRPQAHNALCAELNAELEEALNALGCVPTVRALILTGGEKVFAAGADIRQMLAATPLEARETSRMGQRINAMLEELSIPVIAAICGPALGGGCELALACDFRVMGEHARLGLPEVGLGILPGAGGTQRLTRLIGAARAKEMILLGRQLSAAEALGLGLATAVAPDDRVHEKAAELAAELIKKPAAALMLAKQAVYSGEEHGAAAGRVFENLLFGLTFSSQDQLEGMSAMLERRPPNFTNLR